MTEKFCLILSSSQFLVDMLNNWNEIPLFLQLHHEKNKILAMTSSDDVTADSFSFPVDSKGLFQDIAGGFDFLVGWVLFCCVPSFPHTVTGKVPQSLLQNRTIL